MDASIDNSQTVWIATCSMCVCCYVQCRKWVHVQKGAVDIFLGDCFLFVATGNHCLCRPFIYKVLNTVELCYSRYRKKTWKKINKTHACKGHWTLFDFPSPTMTWADVEECKIFTDMQNVQYTVCHRFKLNEQGINSSNTAICTTAAVPHRQ